MRKCRYQTEKKHPQFFFEYCDNVVHLLRCCVEEQPILSWMLANLFFLHPELAEHKEVVFARSEEDPDEFSDSCYSFSFEEAPEEVFEEVLTQFRNNSIQKLLTNKPYISQEQTFEMLQIILESAARHNLVAFVVKKRSSFACSD